MAGVTYRGMDRARPRWSGSGCRRSPRGSCSARPCPASSPGCSRWSRSTRRASPWLFERLFAWLAYIAVTRLGRVTGCCCRPRCSTPIAHRPVNFTLHQDLAAVGLGMAGIHGVLLGLDATMPFSVVQMLVPGQAPYAPLAVGVGQVAFYLMALVTASFYVRRHIGQRAWRTLHYVTFLAFAGSTAHGIAAGTDSGSPWAQWIYLGAMTVVAFLLAYRIGMSVAERVERRARAASAP